MNKIDFISIFKRICDICMYEIPITEGDFTKHFSVNEINIINYFIKRTDLTFEQKLQIIKENMPKFNNCNPILTIE